MKRDEAVPPGASLSTLGKHKGPPPVHLWDPPYCGEIDIRIAQDGTWFHEGSPIGRIPLVRLFASILRREEGRYFLVTPVEKVGIIVEDVPFIAVDFTVSAPGDAQCVCFSSALGDTVVAGTKAPLRVEIDPKTLTPRPYVMMRAGLEARIDRKSFYRLIEYCSFQDIDGESWFGLRSSGAFFAFSRASAL